MMSSAKDQLSGITVCYVSEGAFSGVTRTMKQARSLSAHGASVVFIGYEGRVPAEILESPFEVILAPERRHISSTSGIQNRALRILANVMVWTPMNLTVNRLRQVVENRRHAHALATRVVHRRPDVVQAVDLTALRQARLAADRLRTPLVYDSHEYWPGFLEGLLPDGQDAYKHELLEVERNHIARADVILCVSDVMADRLVDRYSIGRPVTLYNSPSMDGIPEVREVSDPVRLVFHGGLSHDRNLKGLIEAMVELRGLATLDIHGLARDVDVAELMQMVNELDLGSAVKFHGAFEYDEVLELIRPYDVGVLTAKCSDENFEIALPNKLFDCMCAGLAVAMPDTPAVREILQKVSFGITIDPSSPHSIARDLLSLVSDSDRVLICKRRAVASALYYAWEEQERKLVGLISEVTGCKRRPGVKVDG